MSAICESAYGSLRQPAYGHARRAAASGTASRPPSRCCRAGRDGRRILYAIKEYDPLLDSSCMGVDDWVRIATDIKVSRAEQCGAHGPE